jgi:hypothetical protein
MFMSKGDDLSEELTSQEIQNLVASLTPEHSANQTKPLAGWQEFLGNLFKISGQQLVDLGNRQKAYLLLCQVLDFSFAVRNQGWLGLVKTHGSNIADLPTPVDQWLSQVASGTLEETMVGRIQALLAQSPENLWLVFGGVGVLALQQGASVQSVLEYFAHQVSQSLLHHTTKKTDLQVRLGEHLTNQSTDLSINIPTKPTTSIERRGTQSPAQEIEPSPLATYTVEKLIHQPTSFTYDPYPLGCFWGIGYEPLVQQSQQQPELLYVLDRFFVLNIYNMSLGKVVDRIEVFGPLTFRTRNMLGGVQGAYPSFHYQEDQQVLYILTQVHPRDLTASPTHLNLLVYLVEPQKANPGTPGSWKTSLVDFQVIEGTQGFLWPLSKGVRVLVSGQGYGEYGGERFSGIRSFGKKSGTFTPVVDKLFIGKDFWGLVVNQGLLVYQPTLGESLVLPLTDTWNVRDCKAHGNRIFLSRLEGEIESYQLDLKTKTLTLESSEHHGQTGFFVPDSNHWCGVSTSHSCLELMESSLDDPANQVIPLVKEPRDQMISLVKPLSQGWRVVIHNLQGQLWLESWSTEVDHQLIDTQPLPWRVEQAVWSAKGYRSAAFGSGELRLSSDGELIFKQPREQLINLEAMDDQGRLFLVETSQSKTDSLPPGLQGLVAGWWIQASAGVLKPLPPKPHQEFYECGLDYFGNRWVIGNQQELVSEVLPYPQDELGITQFQWDKKNSLGFFMSGITRRVTLAHPFAGQDFPWSPYLVGQTYHDWVYQVSPTTNRVYGLDGDSRITCYSLESAETLWQFQVPLPDHPHLSKGRESMDLRVLTTNASRDIILVKTSLMIVVLSEQGDWLVLLQDPFGTLDLNTFGLTQSSLHFWIEDQPVEIRVPKLGL